MTHRQTLGFGPRIPENGSWAWIGEDLAREASKEFDTLVWNDPADCACDLLVVVKYALSPACCEAIPRDLPIVYFAVDFFQSEDHVVSVADFLRRCDRVVTSAASLAPLLERFAAIDVLPHHVKFVLPRMTRPKMDGSILWTGVRDNVAPLADWVNAHQLPSTLLVLTNPEPGRSSARDFGFADPSKVSVEQWTPERHLLALAEARAAIDIKGDSFAQQHKPPTKVVDFLAAGIPTALNPKCGPADFLRSFGFEVASPYDTDRWFSVEYADECTRIGAVLREYLSPQRVGERFRAIARGVLARPRLPSARPLPRCTASSPNVIRQSSSSTRPRVALLSFLFNWPSTGGGIVHTIELGKFLARDGFEILHLYACNHEWGIGQVKSELPYRAVALDMNGMEPNLEKILSTYRHAMQDFQPDHAIITDSWNIKPWLASAVGDVPYILRFQALECLCPLNNVRFLPQDGGRFAQCWKHQLATPEACHACIASRGHLSGQLHRWERDLCRVGSPEYDQVLRTAVSNAEALLVVNPDMAIAYGPYSDRVQVVPSGFDPERFSGNQGRRTPGPVRILFAGLTVEWTKGFIYLHEACRTLWRHRTDFELLVTDGLDSDCEPFVRFIGWQSQSALAELMHEADIVVVPTIAQEALGRTAVEAMAAGRPVIASRIGGLRSTVLEGCTGLLFEPGDPFDMAAKIERLLDDPQLREQLGRAGRERFQQHFTWDVIISRYYRPLLQRAPAHRF